MSNKILSWVSFVFLCVLVVASEECNLLLNEINTGTPKNFKNRDFIELKIACENEIKLNSLQGYKIIGISIGNDLQKKGKR